MVSLNRRNFIRTTLVAGSGVLFTPAEAWNRVPLSEDLMLGLHPFIHENPDAVFVMRTAVKQKTDTEAVRQAGLDFGRSIFSQTDDPLRGIPLTHRFVIKPNLTCRNRGHKQYTVERSMGIVTDAHFTEGIIQSMMELGISSDHIHLREVNCPDDLDDGGYTDLAERTGVDVRCVDTHYSKLAPEEIQWMEVENGNYFRRLPFVWPVNAPDSWLLNISKLKAHGMGMTLCAKNLQGTIVKNYQEHCGLWGNPLDTRADDVRTDAFAFIQENYLRHVAQGIPRWDRPGDYGGRWMETWASRCLDNNAVTRAGLHVIEGIYGRDGNFMDGPGEEGLATDYMTNCIIFGLNPFYVDIIGHWIGGHEPGNFGLFHMAREQGRISTMNPANIPVYHWDPVQGATLGTLGNLERFALKTYYLQANFNGGQEDYWHMVNEPFDYDKFSDPVTSVPRGILQLGTNHPNPVTGITHIPFRTAVPGPVRIEVINEQGAVVDVLVDEVVPAGSHMTAWDSSAYPAGLYIYMMRTAGLSCAGRMLVVR